MTRERVLVVDDEPEILRVCREILDPSGADVVTESEAARAVSRLESESFDLAVVDIRMPRQDGLSVLRRAHALDPVVPVLLMTAYPSDDTVESSVALGAVGYVVKPFTPDQLRSAVLRALLERRLRSVAAAPEGTEAYEGLVGRCEPMRRVFGLVDRVAPADVDVLVTGESGTGKELVARALHRRGPRAAGQFVPVDCGAVPPTQLESGLFGREKGASAGDPAEATALVEAAHRGTLFLDEVAELPPMLQAKLLRVVQERRFRRPGETEYATVDVRIVAATIRDPIRDVQEGRLRKDFFYRLNVVRIEVPPLRERREDIPLLFAHFLRQEEGRFGRRIAEVSPEVHVALGTYPWPGNVRELLSAVRRILALGTGGRIAIEDLPAALREPRHPQEGVAAFFGQRARLLRSFERRYLEEALARHRGDVAEAAVEAEMPRGTFYRLMSKYGLRSEDFRGRLPAEEGSPSPERARQPPTGEEPSAGRLPG